MPLTVMLVQFFHAYQHLLQSENYVTRRQSLKARPCCAQIKYRHAPMQHVSLICTQGDCMHASAPATAAATLSVQTLSHARLQLAGCC